MSDAVGEMGDVVAYETPGDAVGVTGDVGAHETLGDAMVAVGSRDDACPDSKVGDSGRGATYIIKEV